MSPLKIFLTCALAWPAALLLPRVAHAGGDEVVVIYNSRMLESRAIAGHYAAVRHVPTNQVFGFELTTNEVISRDEFTTGLQQPLADRLVATGLWQFGDVTHPATKEQPAQTETRVVQSKIRYAVLCYGVPLKIAPSSRLEALMDRFYELLPDVTTRDKLRHNEAAVDSELAWLPLYKLNLPLTGPLRNPFYLCTNRAAMNCTNGLLMVARLDGPTPEIANRLVDKAVQAETTGLWGRAYIDARGLSVTDTNYLLGDEWMLASAYLSRQLGFETEVDTNAATLPASFPMSHIAFYAGWYASDACGPFTAPTMEFMPGAFAYHLYSFSADTLRSTTRNWCGPLLAKGATCTMGCVYEPYLQFTPNVAFFLEAFGNGGTFGEASWASQNTLSWMNTVIGDPLYKPFKQTPPELHALLARTKNPLLEWSFDRLICLDLAHGLRERQLIPFLADLPITARSAVLSEKLAELYDAAGMPSSAIAAWQSALQLHPSPQQRLRLRLTLGEKLTDQGLNAEAVENYRALITEAPDYPGWNAIDEKIKALEQTIAAGKLK